MTIHSHGQGQCHDEDHDHDHVHDHDHPSNTGPGDNLYPHIDMQNVTVLNASEDTSSNKVLKAWHERQDETVVNNTTFVPSLSYVHILTSGSKVMQMTSCAFHATKPSHLSNSLKACIVSGSSGYHSQALSDLGRFC